MEKVLHLNNLDIPNNVIINKNGSTYHDFALWYCDETKISKYPTTYEKSCKKLKISIKTEMQFNQPEIELDFPTREMRDAFFNNFKDLIVNYN